MYISPHWQYISGIEVVYTANWGIIYHLAPTKGTRKQLLKISRQQIYSSYHEKVKPWKMSSPFSISVNFDNLMIHVSLLYRG